MNLSIYKCRQYDTRHECICKESRAASPVQPLHFRVAELGVRKVGQYELRDPELQREAVRLESYDNLHNHVKPSSHGWSLREFLA